MIPICPPTARYSWRWVLLRHTSKPCGCAQKSVRRKVYRQWLWTCLLDSWWWIRSISRLLSTWRRDAALCQLTVWPIQFIVYVSNINYHSHFIRHILLCYLNCILLTLTTKPANSSFLKTMGSTWSQSRLTSRFHNSCNGTKMGTAIGTHSSDYPQL